MFKSKLERFIVRRALICMILLLIILQNSWLTLAGLILGTLVSIIKFGLNAWVLEGMYNTGSNTKRKYASNGRAVLFAVSQLILLPLLFLAYFINQWFFAALVAGALSIPVVIMINSITEAFGITKNHFE